MTPSRHEARAQPARPLVIVTHRFHSHLALLRFIIFPLPLHRTLSLLSISDFHCFFEVFEDVRAASEAALSKVVKCKYRNKGDVRTGLRYSHYASSVTVVHEYMHSSTR